MLSIYTKKEFIPDGKYVLDNDSFFIYTGVKDREDIKNIISYINNCTLVDGHVIDRFGFRIYPDMLSMGSKTLINIASSDNVFDGRELGYNALMYLFDNIDGNVYFENGNIMDLPDEVIPDRFIINGIPVNTEKEFGDLLC